jgi:hypothetical protein
MESAQLKEYMKFQPKDIHKCFKKIYIKKYNNNGFLEAREADHNK